MYEEFYKKVKTIVGLDETSEEKISKIQLMLQP